MQFKTACARPANIRLPAMRDACYFQAVVEKHPMQTSDRGNDNEIDDERFLLRELHGRTVALEVIAMTCLALVLDTESESDVETSAGILASIEKTVASRCRELDLPGDVCKAAGRYVEHLTATARTSLLNPN